MSTLIDPNLPPEQETEDFVSQSARVIRQRKLAEQLRKQQQEYTGDQGQMMSGRYVRAPLAGHISSGLQRMGATRAERQADTTEQAYSQNVNRARQQWASSFPKATAAMAERQGPMDEANPNELNAKPGLPLTMAQITEHATKGLAIPLNKEAAELYNRNSVADLTREDQQAEKANQAELKRTFDREQEVKKHEGRLEELKIKMAGQVTPEQKMTMFREADATKRYLGKLAADAKIEAAEKAARAKGQNVKPVPENVRKSLSGAEEIADSTMRAFTTYKPQYGGFTGLYDQIRGMLPGADPAQEEATNWWSMYDKGGLKERHDIFGATLTGNEATAWANATIRKGQSAATIMQNLQIRAELAAKHFNKERERSIKLGYPQVNEAYEPLPEGATTQVPMQPPIRTQPPQQQLQPMPAPPRQVPLAPQGTPQVQPGPGGARPLGPGATSLGFTRGQ